MLVITDEEAEALRQLQEEHEAFWREQYPPYRPPLKERLWDWISDHQTLMTVIVAVLLVGLLIVSCVFTWMLAVGLILFMVGVVIYIIGCMASGIVQWILDLLV